jgi:hypothetical protein
MENRIPGPKIPIPLLRGAATPDSEVASGLNSRFKKTPRISSQVFKEPYAIALP